PFLILEKSISCISQVQPEFEPEKSLANKRKRELIGSLNPRKRGHRHVVRTNSNEKMLGGQKLVREIIRHIIGCEEECPELLIVLRLVFSMVSEYQLQAA